MNLKAVKPGMTIVFRDYEEIGNLPRRQRGQDPVEFGFPSHLRYLCGKMGIVKEIDDLPDSRKSIKLVSNPVNSEGEDHLYFISAEMIEPYIEESNPPELIEEPDISFLLG